MFFLQRGVLKLVVFGNVFLWMFFLNWGVFLNSLVRIGGVLKLFFCLRCAPFKWGFIMCFVFMVCPCSGVPGAGLPTVGPHKETQHGSGFIVLGSLRWAFKENYSAPSFWIRGTSLGVWNIE